MAPPRHRGAFGIGFRLSQAVGVVLASLVNFSLRNIEGNLGWRVSLSLTAIPAFLLMLGALLLPETPVGILQRSGNLHKTVGALQRIRGTTDIISELDDIVAPFSADSAAATRPFTKIARREYRPQLVTAIAIPLFAQLTGFRLMAFHAQILLQTTPMQAALALGLTGAAANVVAMVMADRVGRRVMFMIGGGQMFATLAALGGIMAARVGYRRVPITLIFIHVTGSELSWGPLGWSVPSETFPLEIRLAGQSISAAANFLFGLVMAHSFGTMHCAFKSSTFFFFGGCVLAMTVFVYLLLPETKSVPMERMEHVWKEHWVWRRMTVDAGECGPTITV